MKKTAMKIFAVIISICVLLGAFPLNSNAAVIDSDRFKRHHREYQAEDTGKRRYLSRSAEIDLCRQTA